MKLRNAVRATGALLLLLVACGTEPEIVPTVSGTWHGASSGWTLHLTLTENGGAISGSGSITPTGGPSQPLTVGSGAHAHPDVSLTLQASGFEDMLFTGELITTERINGQLDGSGFDAFVINLDKL